MPKVLAVSQAQIGSSQSVNERKKKKNAKPTKKLDIALRWGEMNFIFYPFQSRQYRVTEFNSEPVGAYIDLQEITHMIQVLLN